MIIPEPYSKLLIPEEPLQVLPQLAAEIGLNEAIVLQQLHYWLRNPNVGALYECRQWVYNTYDQWRTNFPFWSVDTIKRTILKLEQSGIVESTDRFNKDTRDRTKWYTINYDHEILRGGNGNLPHSTSGAICTSGEGNLPHSTIEQRLPTETTAETIVSRKAKSSGIPADFSLSDRMIEWGKRQEPPFRADDMMQEVPQFVDYWLAKGEARKDWEASFRTWMRNSRKFAQRPLTATQSHGNAKRDTRYLDPAELLARAAELEEQERDRSTAIEDSRRALD